MKRKPCKICGKILEMDGLVIIDRAIAYHGIGLDKFVNEGTHIVRLANIPIEKL